jgi:lipid A 3-O-deacylase
VVRNTGKLLRMRLLLTSCLLALCSAKAQADWKPDRFILQGGVAHSQDVRSVSAGLGWDGAWKGSLGPFAVGWQAQLLWSHWRARDFGGGMQGFHQLALVPVARLGFDRGRSPWYLEGGIGLSYMDRLYVGPDKTMSTRFNFYDMLGVGRQFGADGAHELGLRYVHLSNARIKRPNPGEDFVLVYYARKF